MSLISGAESQIPYVLAGWRRLFESLKLDETQQEAEFDFIMHARGPSGVMAVVAPDAWVVPPEVEPE
jgi:hypothetical protein